MSGWSHFSTIRPAIWGLAVATLLGLSLLWGQAMNLIGPSAPVYVDLSTETDGMQPDGTWRVDRTVTVREKCRMMVATRIFTGQSVEGPVVDLQLPAVDGSNVDALGPVVARPGREPGERRGWLAYKLPPGFHGLYTVRVVADGCPSGFSGWFQLYTATVP